MKKRKAIYPGSFDPVTNGHIDIIRRALSLFDEVTVLVAGNHSKKTMFTVEERMRFIRQVFKNKKGIKVDSFDGLTVNFAKKSHSSTLIRGIRATSDFDYEFQMALTNRKLAPKIETVFLMPSESHFYLSSRLIKEIASLHGEVGHYVPSFVARELKKKFNLETKKI